MQSRLTRRSAIAALTSTTAAVAAMAPAAALTIGATPDPIFAAIEQHKRMAELFTAACHVSSALDHHDPRHGPAETATADAADAMEDAAVELVNIQPTTKAGTIALLRYIASEELHDWSLPQHVVDPTEDDDEEAATRRTLAEPARNEDGDIPFLVAALHHVADALAAMEPQVS